MVKPPRTHSHECINQKHCRPLILCVSHILTHDHLYIHNTPSQPKPTLPASHLQMCTHTSHEYVHIGHHTRLAAAPLLTFWGVSSGVSLWILSFLFLLWKGSLIPDSCPPGLVRSPSLYSWPLSGSLATGVLPQTGGISSRTSAGTQLQQTSPYHLDTDSHKRHNLTTIPLLPRWGNRTQTPD